MGNVEEEEEEKLKSLLLRKEERKELGKKTYLGCSSRSEAIPAAAAAIVAIVVEMNLGV